MKGSKFTEAQKAFILKQGEQECPELYVSGPVHAVWDTQASKRSPNIRAN